MMLWILIDRARASNLTVATTLYELGKVINLFIPDHLGIKQCYPSLN